MMSNCVSEARPGHDERLGWATEEFQSTILGMAGWIPDLLP